MYCWRKAKEGRKEWMKEEDGKEGGRGGGRLKGGRQRAAVQAGGGSKKLWQGHR